MLSASERRTHARLETTLLASPCHGGPRNQMRHHLHRLRALIPIKGIRVGLQPHPHIRDHDRILERFLIVPEVIRGQECRSRLHRRDKGSDVCPPPRSQDRHTSGRVSPARSVISGGHVSEFRKSTLLGSSRPRTGLRRPSQLAQPSHSCPNPSQYPPGPTARAHIENCEGRDLGRAGGWRGTCQPLPRVPT